MTETEIANLAISMIGGKSLTALSTDNTPQAVTCRKWFDPARDEALASHPWNFATKRWRNEIAWTALSGVALADAGASDEIRVTATAHGLVTGDRVHIKEVSGVDANGTWYVTRIDANNFDLDDSVFSGAHTSGTGSWVKAPLFGWDYQHTLPADCLRVVNVNGFEANENDSVPYAVELGKLLTNEDIVTLRYVYKNETQTEWSQHFINAFALLLASYIAQDLTGPSGKAAELRGRFEQQIGPKAKGQDARQGKGRVIDPDYDSRVVRARRNFLA
jgi:hypothetical protein